MKRVLVLMLTVMVAFWLTGCGSSVSQEELDALNKQNSELQEQIDALESRLSATPTPSPWSTAVSSKSQGATPPSGRSIPLWEWRGPWPMRAISWSVARP